MEPHNTTRRSDGDTVETRDYVVGQAYNGHIHVYNKSTGRMMLHVSCSSRYSRAKLQAFADRFQEINNPGIRETVEAMQVLN